MMTVLNSIQPQQFFGCCQTSSRTSWLSLFYKCHHDVCINHGLHSRCISNVRSSFFERNHVVLCQAFRTWVASHDKSDTSPGSHKVPNSTSNLNRPSAPAEHVVRWHRVQWFLDRVDFNARRHSWVPQQLATQCLAPPLQNAAGSSPCLSKKMHTQRQQSSAGFSWTSNIAICVLICNFFYIDTYVCTMVLLYNRSWNKYIILRIKMISHIIEILSYIAGSRCSKCIFFRMSLSLHDIQMLAANHSETVLPRLSLQNGPGPFGARSLEPPRTYPSEAISFDGWLFDGFSSCCSCKNVNGVWVFTPETGN